jgi:hypothetical protein
MNKHKGNNKISRDNLIDEGKSSNTSKDIKNRMDRFEAKISSRETPSGDATTSDE